MQTTEKIKKINVPYLLLYILVPLALIVGCGVLYATVFKKGAMAPILSMAPTLLAALWWVGGGRLLFKMKQKKVAAALKQRGFVPNSTFNGKNCHVVVDAQHGEIALLFFWNPFQCAVLPANRITRVWVDDGATGSGIMRGSSRVSFLFTLDNVTIRVNTFTSNKRWNMDSNYILTGISKADMMANVLKEAAKVEH
ncbi:MAG: hypothetical protein J1E00_04815 [Oscillospiraceae bacterium]|nr:hypothetical protein [Oscillospiraceae bacterium]